MQLGRSLGLPWKRINRGIRWIAESRSESNGEVGYGHSSEEGPKMRAWSEGSLVSRCLETEGRDRMNAQKAQPMLEEERLGGLDYKLELVCLK